MMPSASQLVMLLATAAAAVNAAADTPTVTTHVPACTATSSTGNGGFFDLRPDAAVPLPENGKTYKSVLYKDYHSRGYDYGKNFTLNICGAVVDPVSDVVGLSKNQWANVSAYYTTHNSVYSIGSVSLDLHSRGRKLVLQYTGGSPCGESRSNESTSKIRRKSATISFLCDRDPGTTTAVSFVGVDPDECAYFFEARSVHACAGAEPHKPGSVGPGSVFGLILVIAVLVYILGGVFYNRTVAHARGWRQLPNYSLWAGIASFFSDLFVILLSSCGRLLPSRRGYQHLGSGGIGRNSEAENRLIDQLDEEWDD
ncbi:mannose 6-phosphate receptor domain-containing protein [Trichoderma citrinoviride]|uniref:Mannose 6-phosphate receptor domain-containing protein n=1 Tax=Trichoderma citrinoviride TaxID=58853 RepID=A0A2T4BAE3_9HYPO|nr:mannose 6-phosphate receptor domain-containing protein [Trichoderma citrinoviride]PTB66258.1 mannose 6-phosphate receptor domain-containing protein [Trichoderma citrinoviride]